MTNDTRDNPDVKQTQYVWHLMVPVTVFGDQTDVDVADRLHTLARNCVEKIVIEGDGLPGKVVCGEMTASTLEPLGEEAEEETFSLPNILNRCVPIVVNAAIDLDARHHAARTIANALLLEKPMKFPKRGHDETT